MKNRILFMGDSHAARVALQARKQYDDLHVVGGNFLGVGEAARLDFFRYGEGGLHFADPDVQAQFRQFAREAGVDSDNVLDLTVPVAISAMGVDRLARAHVARTSVAGGRPPLFLTRQLATVMVREVYREMLRFLTLLKDAGHNFVYILSPGLRQNSNGEGPLFLKLQGVLREELDAHGLACVDVTAQTCDDQGLLLRQFWPDDPEDQTHGNEAWAAMVALACLQRFGIRPTQPAAKPEVRSLPPA